MHHVCSFFLAGILIIASARAQQFGGAISMTDHHIFIGEALNVAYPGEVYIYARKNPAAEPHILSVNQELERFGRTIVANAEILLVGAHEADGGRGAVYVFQTDTWEQVARLTASDAEIGDQFGYSIALGMGELMIGASGRMESAGSVYVFRENNDGTFSETTILTAEGLEPGDSFGSAVAIEKNKAVISAVARGAAYAFLREPQGWRQTTKLAPDFLTEQSRMGSAVLLHRGRIYVGAPKQGQGIVLEYKWDKRSSQFRMSNQFQPFNREDASQFGTALAAREDELWIGANLSNQGRGRVHQFRSGENGWTEISQLMPNESIGRAAFGSRIAVQGDIAVIGSVYMDSRAGGAIILRHGGTKWVTETILINQAKGHDAVTGGEIRCTEGMALRWACMDVDLTSFLPIPEIGGSRGSRLNDIWGWVDSETSREYALVGRNDGTSFVDVTHPEYPRYVGNLPMPSGSVANVWRDIKVYADHAFIVADGAGQHGVQVFDLTQLREIKGEPVTFKETLNYAGVASAHNIVVNEETGYGFIVGANGGGETCGGGLHMLDLRDSPRVRFVGCFADPNTGRRKTGYSHDAQCVIYSGTDVRYSGKEICFGSNETALSIADVTDKDNPVAISMATYPKVAYTHQGWLAEDHQYFYMNDEGDEPQGLVEGTRTLIWDVSDLEDPVLVKEYIAHTSDTDHNLYISGNLMYQSNYGAGLRILDLTKPEDPEEIGFFEPGPGSTSWSNYPYFESGTLIVTSRSEGIFVLKRRALDI